MQGMKGFFGRKYKTSSNSRMKLPNVVGNAQGSDNISVMWQEHYSHIFNLKKCKIPLLFFSTF